LDFELVAGNLALDFTNTIHSYGEADPRDDLRTFADFAGWCRQAGLLQKEEERIVLRSAQAVAQRCFRRALELRETLYHVFCPIASQGKASLEALRQLEAHFRRAMAEVSIQKAGERYEMGWSAVLPLDRVLNEIAGSAMDLLTSERLPRVRQCAGEKCSWLFLDTSRGGQRRWCDMQACGNRAKVRRFRRR